MVVSKYHISVLFIYTKYKIKWTSYKLVVSVLSLLPTEGKVPHPRWTPQMISWSHLPAIPERPNRTSRVESSVC